MTEVPRRLRRVNRGKRNLDVVLVVVASPFLAIAMAITAVVVRIAMGKPVLFRQDRVGLEERVFTLYKFRTMSSEKSPNGEMLPDHARLTRTGRAIRKLSLDELPQFVNLLRGDMALIGPRPLYPDYLPYYRGRERNRHLVRPGLTGLAQVSGRNSLYWDDRLSVDADYVEQVGAFLDAKILARTIKQVLGGSGVSTVANDSGERLDVLRSYPSENGLALRRFEYSDVPQRVSLFRHPTIRQYMTLPEEITEESTVDWVRRSRLRPANRDFVVYETSNQEVVSMLGLRERAVAGVPEMYILIDPVRHGRGLGGTSLRLLLTWMRSHDGYSGCWLTVRRDNNTAVALYRRAGFGEVAEEGLDSNRVAMQLDWAERKP